MRKIFLAAAVLLSALSAGAQGVSEMLRFSQYDYSMGTARSTAMGGAFTSLGADLSSMSINPAGLGMYRSSDAGVSVSLAGNSMESGYSGLSSSDNRTRFSLSNFGVVFNSYQSSSSLTSFSIGFAYNKLADFNTTQSFSGQTPLNSITEVFAEQLSGVSQSTLNKGGYTPFDDVSVDQWGGVLAWQTAILDPATNGSGQEIDGAYTPFYNLDPEATVYNAMKNVSRGYVAEYDLSMGANINNILYVGLTVGIQDVSYTNANYYDESYSSYSDDYPLQSMMYDRHSKLTGTGINVKLGVIFRPVELLRIGVAYHSPTWLNLESVNIDMMSAEYLGKTSQGMLDSPYLYNDISMQTPSRFLAGASLTIPNIGIISADYERVWYQGMKMGYNDGYDGYYGGISYDRYFTDLAQSMFTASDNFRFGVEVTPMENVFIRGGYASYGSAFTYDDYVSPNGMPDKTSWTNISAGVGLRFGNTYFDITYVHTVADYNVSDIFYTTYNDGSGDVVIESGQFSTKLIRDAVTLTLGTRF
ncbi:MAG: hypothetical protein R3Y15_05720 [Rikenellaceae bacterium]